MQNSIATYYVRVQEMPDKEYKVEILEDGLIKKIALNGVVYEVDYNIGGDSIHSIIIGNRSHGVQISSDGKSSYEVRNRGETYLIDLMGELDKIRNIRTESTPAGRQLITAPMPGVLLKFYVKPGDVVTKNTPLCVLVAMKMENEIRSNSEGTVKEIFINENSTVATGEKIMIID